MTDFVLKGLFLQQARGLKFEDTASLEWTFDAQTNTITAEADAGGPGVTDHGALTGLADDDHPQYAAIAQAESIIGQWQWSTALWGPNGTAGAPSFTFTSDPDTGFYRVGANNLGIATGGALHWDIDTARVFQDIPLTVRSYDGILVQNQDLLGTSGIELITFSGPNPAADGIGNQLAFWEDDIKEFGFRFHHGGDVDITGTLHLYQHASDPVGVEVFRILRDKCQLRSADGTVGEPFYTFFNDPDTGFYRIGADSIGLSLGGVLHTTFSASGVFPAGVIRGPDGTAGAPAYSFASDTDTGMYLGATGSLGFSHSGTFRLALSATIFSCTLPFQGAAGSVGTPALSFTGDPNTGIYNINPDEIGFSTGAGLRLTLSSTALVSTVLMRGPDGSAGAPTYSFSSDTDTGMYLGATGSIGWSHSGTVRLALSATIFSSTLPVQGAAGSNGTPSFSFTADPNTGIYNPNADEVGISTNGVLRLTAANARITSTVPIRHPGYTVATLPAGAAGDRAYVTDALAPAFLVAVVGGGAVVTPVFYNGAAWVAA